MPLEDYLEVIISEFVYRQERAVVWYLDLLEWNFYQTPKQEPSIKALDTEGHRERCAGNTLLLYTGTHISDVSLYSKLFKHIFH